MILERDLIAGENMTTLAAVRTLKTMQARLGAIDKEGKNRAELIALEMGIEALEQSNKLPIIKTEQEFKRFCV